MLVRSDCVFRCNFAYDMHILSLAIEGLAVRKRVFSCGFSSYSYKILVISFDIKEGGYLVEYLKNKSREPQYQLTYVVY